ncbi:DNA repair protein rad8, partial [Diplogelasinospora grovesii]
MGSVDPQKFIAAGCLILDEAESNIPHELWSLPGLKQWRSFDTSVADSRTPHGGEGAHRSARFGNDGDGKPLSVLPPEVEELLLSSKPLSQFAGLLMKGWMRMSFSVSLDAPTQGIVRVYLLPDDVDNLLVPRFDPRLRKARRSLLSLLDFSRSAWCGEAATGRQPSPSTQTRLATRDAGDASNTPHDQGQTLLQMFNSIPSPDPRPDVVDDFYAEEAMYKLINSDIPGLTTSLYPYQRRSAALMLQREAQPRPIPDPRLTKVVDQLGRPWYYDEVAAIGLREPIFYDGPCGGVLAEEMGSGKTLICLALILATRQLPAKTPDIYRVDRPVVRPRIGSLADMAAACITQNSVPWKPFFEEAEADGVEYTHCLRAIRRNPGYYLIPRPPPDRRLTRSQRPHDVDELPRATVYLSHASIVIVPPNLLQQWKQEIAKHTSNLKVFVLAKAQQPLPSTETLLDYDVLLFSSTRFEKLVLDSTADSPLSQIHFKRCIVDEGHKLGNSTSGTKSNLHLAIDALQITARWIVTGTPSKGLFGVDDSASPASTPNGDGVVVQAHDGGNSSRRLAESSREFEKDDLRRIWSIASLYLKMRPWANTAAEAGDRPAEWSVYVMQDSRRAGGTTRGRDCLKSTLESLIIRHRLSEIGTLLPAVNEKFVYLDGSYQDTLVLNLFSMMIIFNAVQSQRTDQDYFFHPRQRKALIELVSNLRQASFFGGSFFSPADILKAVDTAEQFLKEGKVPIGPEDEALLRQAISFGRVAASNHLKECANLFREIPVYVENFPFGAGRAWSLDNRDGDPVCMDSVMILALQKFLRPVYNSPYSLQLLVGNGRLAEQGTMERRKGIEAQDLGHNNNHNSGGDAATQERAAAPRKTLAGNTQLGQDNSSPQKRLRSIATLGTMARMEEIPSDAQGLETIAAPLAKTQLVSTASAKLSYLIDQVVQHQRDEQIIIFYENDNVAYYLAGMLEILQIHHLIYAKALTADRRAQYVATFNLNPKFRVLLMDMTQAAFGLDMRSASRIYFINPVLNPQVEAQAIGRARRISQKRSVTVETLVLRGSLEEVIVRRRGEMTQAEQRKCARSILDDKPIYEWILNARILPLPLPDRRREEGLPDDDRREGGLPQDSRGQEEMARLQHPQYIFGRGALGRELEAHDHDPDRDLVEADHVSPTDNNNNNNVGRGRTGLKK